MHTLCPGARDRCTLPEPTEQRRDKKRHASTCLRAQKGCTLACLARESSDQAPQSGLVPLQAKSFEDLTLENAMGRGGGAVAMAYCFHFSLNLSPSHHDDWLTTTCRYSSRRLSPALVSVIFFLPFPVKAS